MDSSKYKVNPSDCIDYKRKDVARRTVAAAMKEGLIKRPNTCDLCTLEHNKLAAHHVDYGNPLHIYWLCSTCHGVVHKKNHPLNPKNNVQTPTSLNWKGYENQMVSFSIPFENFIVIKKLADEKKISIPKFLRGVILKEFPVDDDQLTFDFEARKTNDNPQNDTLKRAQGMDEDQDALLQQKRQKLQELRRPRSESLPGMEKFIREVL
jgi:hypothetical protein